MNAFFANSGNFPTKTTNIIKPARITPESIYQFNQKFLFQKSSLIEKNGQIYFDIVSFLDFFVKNNESNLAPEKKELLDFYVENKRLEAFRIFNYITKIIHNNEAEKVERWFEIFGKIQQKIQTDIYETFINERKKLTREERLARIAKRRLYC